MRILHHWTEPTALTGAVVALGNFDGVHLGHRAVLDAAGRAARAAGRPWAALSFEPHPRSVFRPGDPPFRLTPFPVKARLLDEAGLDLLYSLPFDTAFSRLDARTFVDAVLVAGIGATHLVSGPDFAFGHGRGGSVALLEALGPARGFAVTAVPPVVIGGEPVSSSRIRRLLAEGRPREAARLLGRDWEIEGVVETGDRRGRTLGFPTANIALGETLAPATGVYAVRAALAEPGAPWWDGVANFGRRPTVGGTAPRLEAHLFDVAPDLYGRRLRVRLVDHLRPERKFDGLAALTAQIAEDGRRARAALAAEVPASAR